MEGLAFRPGSHFRAGPVTYIMLEAKPADPAYRGRGSWMVDIGTADSEDAIREIWFTDEAGAPIDFRQSGRSTNCPMVLPDGTRTLSNSSFYFFDREVREATIDVKYYHGVQKHTVPFKFTRRIDKKR
ncbi:MAG: hypothetical protein AMK75_02885 [Planctomycetes bacterium SM23_65]|nr:MAG: hypothetical protein AMK75_02885 [Planctomycetes bacterium SM23_65]